MPWEIVLPIHVAGSLVWFSVVSMMKDYLVEERGWKADDGYSCYLILGTILWEPFLVVTMFVRAHNRLAAWGASRRATSSSTRKGA